MLLDQTKSINFFMQLVEKQDTERTNRISIKTKAVCQLTRVSALIKNPTRGLHCLSHLISTQFKKNQAIPKTSTQTTKYTLYNIFYFLAIRPIERHNP